MIAAAVGFWALTLLLLWTMAEADYSPRHDVDRSAGLVWLTFRSGLGTVRGRPTLVMIPIVGVLLGVASEAFDRLWPLHLLDNVGLSGGIDEVVWFGLIGLTHQATDLDDPRQVVRTLLVLVGLLTISSFAFALAGTLWLALAAIWLVVWVRRAMDPLTLAWINRGLDPNSRATVPSMLSQDDALGQIAGGVGSAGGGGSATSVRTSLLGMGAIVAPALLLHGHVWRREDPSASRHPRRQRKPTRDLTGAPARRRVAAKVAHS